MKRLQNAQNMVGSGHSWSLAMSPVNTARTTSYLYLIESIRLFCTVFEIQRVISRLVTDTQTHRQTYTHAHTHRATPWPGIARFICGITCKWQVELCDLSLTKCHIWAHTLDIMRYANVLPTLRQYLYWDIVGHQITRPIARKLFSRFQGHFTLTRLVPACSREEFMRITCVEKRPLGRWWV